MSSFCVSADKNRQVYTSWRKAKPAFSGCVRRRIYRFLWIGPYSASHVISSVCPKWMCCLWCVCISRDVNQSPRRAAQSRGHSCLLMGDKTDKPRKKYSAVINVWGGLNCRTWTQRSKKSRLCKVGGGGWGMSYGKASVPLLDFSRVFLLTPRKVQLSGISCRCNPSPKILSSHLKGVWMAAGLFTRAWQTIRAPFSGWCHRTARDVVSLWPISIVSFLINNK